jgi:hypothetical protein
MDGTDQPQLILEQALLAQPISEGGRADTTKPDCWSVLCGRRSVRVGSRDDRPKKVVMHGVGEQLEPVESDSLGRLLLAEPRL